MRAISRIGEENDTLQSKMIKRKMSLQHLPTLIHVNIIDTIVELFQLFFVSAYSQISRNLWPLSDFR